MVTKGIQIGRRAALVNLIGWSTLGLKWLFSPARSIYAMGAFDYPEGIQEARGSVTINGITAGVGAVVNIGDTVATGPKGFAIFVVNKSVYLIRENTTLELTAATGAAPKSDIKEALKILNGKMLAVFGRLRRRKRIVTSTAVIGVRGSGIYVESDPHKSYICTCYGIADIEAKADASVNETVKTSYHEAPRFVYAAGAEKLIEPAPVFNHTDEELIKLENFVYRQPAFIEDDPGGGGGGGGGY